MNIIFKIFKSGENIMMQTQEIKSQPIDEKNGELTNYARYELFQLCPLDKQSFGSYLLLNLNPSRVKFSVNQSESSVCGLKQQEQDPIF
jgi:hypothetical protein